MPRSPRTSLEVVEAPRVTGKDVDCGVNVYITPPVDRLREAIVAEKMQVQVRRLSGSQDSTVMIERKGERTVAHFFRVHRGCSENEREAKYHSRELQAIGRAAAEVALQEIGVNNIVPHTAKG